jgi:hypothetical protein
MNARRTDLMNRKSEVESALNGYTKDTLYKILVNLSSDWKMDKTERKTFNKPQYVEWVVKELYNEDDDDEVESWIDGIVAKEEWIWT